MSHNETAKLFAAITEVIELLKGINEKLESIRTNDR